MPIHEFKCTSCGESFEELVRSNADRSGVACPKCGGAKVDRQFSVFAAHSNSGNTKRTPAMPMGGCGRCGDPAGPCSLDG